MMNLSQRRRRLLYGVELAGAIVLSFHFLALVHSARYTGSPAWAEFTAKLNGQRALVKTTWHTRLTGLYSVQ
jgi:hypothetical protein